MFVCIFKELYFLPPKIAFEIDDSIRKKKMNIFRNEIFIKFVFLHFLLYSYIPINYYCNYYFYYISLYTSSHTQLLTLTQKAFLVFKNLPFGSKDIGQLYFDTTYSNA